MRHYLFPCLFLALALLPSLPPISQAATPGAKPFNPDISVNFLGLAQHGTAYSDSRTAKPRNGLSLQEAELQVTSDVDAYFRANALFSIAQESGSASYGISPEEVYLETLSLPVVTLRAGKFKMALGRHNQLHTHTFPFIDAPLIHTTLLGDEGLNETGVSASALMPTRWFSEITLQAFTLGNESLTNHYSSGDLGGLARLRNLWDLNDSLTMELGLSGASGKNQFGKAASVLGSDLTFKWRPAQGGKYRALVWSTEYLYGRRPGLTQERNSVQESLERLGGLATWVQYQFAERWWAQARYEYTGLQRSEGFSPVRKESLLLGFFPSEFSGLRLQYAWTQDGARPRNDRAVALQYNVTIGAHPAHAY